MRGLATISKVRSLREVDIHTCCYSVSILFRSYLMPMPKMAAANPNLVLSEKAKNTLSTQDWPVTVEAGSKPGFQKFIGLSWFESHSPSGREHDISNSSFFAETSKYPNRETRFQYVISKFACSNVFPT